MGATFEYFLRPNVCMNYGSSDIKTIYNGFDITRIIFLKTVGVSILPSERLTSTPQNIFYIKSVLAALR